MRIDYILKAAAKRMHHVAVAWDSAFCTVSISTPGQDDIFMQGDDATAFIDEIESMGNRCRSLSPDLIALALAEPYTDLWE